MISVIFSYSQLLVFLISPQVSALTPCLFAKSSLFVVSVATCLQMVVKSTFLTLSSTTAITSISLHFSALSSFILNQIKLVFQPWQPNFRTSLTGSVTLSVSQVTTLRVWVRIPIQFIFLLLQWRVKFYRIFLVSVFVFSSQFICPHNFHSKLSSIVSQTNARMPSLTLSPVWESTAKSVFLKSAFPIPFLRRGREETNFVEQLTMMWALYVCYLLKFSHPIPSGRY